MKAIAKEPLVESLSGLQMNPEDIDKVLKIVDEAEVLGTYIPKKEYVKFEPCLCGKNSRGHWYKAGTDLCQYKCNYCGLEGPWASGRKEAKIEWNKMILSERRSSQ